MRFPPYTFTTFDVYGDGPIPLADLRYEFQGEFRPPNENEEWLGRKGTICAGKFSAPRLILRRIDQPAVPTEDAREELLNLFYVDDSSLILQPHCEGSPARTR